MQSCHLDPSWDPKGVLGGLCNTDLWSLQGHLNRTISHNSMQPLAILWFGFWRILRKMCDCTSDLLFVRRCPKPASLRILHISKHRQCSSAFVCFSKDQRHVNYTYISILDTTTIRRVFRKPDCIRLWTLVKPKRQNSKEWYDFRHRHCETTKLESPNPEDRYALGVSRNSVHNNLQLPGTCFEDIDSNISVHTKQQIISTYQISKHHTFLIETSVLQPQDAMLAHQKTCI